MVPTSGGVKFESTHAIIQLVQTIYFLPKHKNDVTIESTCCTIIERGRCCLKAMLLEIPIELMLVAYNDSWEIYCEYVFRPPFCRNLVSSWTF